jgi:pimeloyl-ACP methyl ester carboxylesterase
MVMHSRYLADLDAYLRYIDLPGEAPVCVYIHGFGSASTADFPRIAGDPQLAAYRALLVDLLGYGYSDRPASFSHTFAAHAEIIARLLDHLGVRDCQVIGHSMGGSVAIALASARPDLVAGLVVAEPSLDADDAFFSGTVVARWPSETEYVATGHTALLAEEEREARAATSSLLAGSYAGTLRTADPRGYHRCARALVACDLRDTFFALEMPRTYIYGARTLPHRHQPWLESSDVSVAVVPDAGHDMPGDNPEAFAAAIASTLPQRQPARVAAASQTSRITAEGP